MVDAKPVYVSLGGHFKLSKAQEPKTDEKSLMSKVSYASTMSSLMYAISLYEAKYCSSSGSYPQIHEQSRAEAMESN